MRRLLALSLLIVLAGCPPSDLCANVICKGGKICEAETGNCIGDGGTPDSGSGGGSGGGTATGGGPSDSGFHDCPQGCFTATRPLCDYNTGKCVGCFDDTDCFECPKRVCDTAGTHLCYAADPDGGLPDGGSIYNAPIAGESCGSYANLVYPVCQQPRTFSFTLDLAGLFDDEQGSCNPAAGGHDAVYAIDTDQTYDLTVTVTPLDAQVSPVVYLREGFCEGDDLVCKQGLNSPVTFTLKSRPADTYFLVIDTLDATSVGTVRVDITWAAPTQPGNETCALADDSLPLDGGTTLQDGGLRIVDLSNATPDLFTSCNAAGGNDVVYQVSLDSTSDLLVTATGVGNPAAQISPVVEVRTPDCQASSEKKCRSSFQYGPTQVRLRSQPAGDYFIVVQTPAPAGPVVVSVAQQAPSAGPANESCTSAAQIPAPTDGGYTVTLPAIDISDAHDDEHGACSAATTTDGGSPEVVYHLQLNAARNVLVQAIPDPHVQPVLYLRSTMCETGTELYCIGGDAGVISGNTVLDAGLLGQGDYWLFVETPKPNDGVVRLSVTVAP